MLQFYDDLNDYIYKYNVICNSLVNKNNNKTKKKKKYCVCY